MLHKIWLTIQPFTSLTVNNYENGYFLIKTDNDLIILMNNTIWLPNNSAIH